MERSPVGHPCFNAGAAGTCGRVHLPVAPKCNVLCSYCNRKYDCQNESRPGVTSAVLTPFQALNYLDALLPAMPMITVVGIAGPGDPFANPLETLETIRLVRSRHPGLLICLSTNGLGLPDHLDAVAALGVTHVTVTVNAVDPSIGQHFYRWVRDGKMLYSGLEAAERMRDRQLEAIRGLKKRGIAVKVNTIVTPGVNEAHVGEVAKTMAALSVDLLNLIPLYPTAGTSFAAIPEPSAALLETLRADAETLLPQMRNCQRCRADAAGLLSSDHSAALAGCLKAYAAGPLSPGAGERANVAVATREGILVNRHLGEADVFQIWSSGVGEWVHREDRRAPAPGGGGERWMALADLLKDCRAVLVSGIGETPRALLGEAGIRPVVMDGLIEQGLAAVFGGGDLSRLGARNARGCGGGCGGGGTGCG